MKALLLAGGKGTRLSPLTDFIPKCLAPIQGRPLIDYWISALVENEITEIIINTHHLNNLVESYIENSTWKNIVTIVYEPSLLGTGGTILQNQVFFQKDDFLVAHADNMFNFTLEELFKSHKNRDQKSIATMLTFYTDEPYNCGVVSVDENSIIQKFDEKNPLLSERSLANAAIYIFSNKIYDYFESDPGDFTDLSLDIIPKMIGSINCCIHAGEIIDIGTMAAWNNANLHTDSKISEFLEPNQKAWNTVLKNISST
jgi:mannose-1-phosphate guanylyltransferase